MRWDLPAEVIARALRTRVVVRHEQFTLPKSLGSATTLRVGFASDFHAGPTTPTRIIERACEALAEARPDLVLLGGDFVSLRGRDATRVLEPLRQIRPPLGKFAVLGNHDLWSEPDEVLAVLERADVQLLDNASMRLPAPFQRTLIVGLDDHFAGVPDASKPTWDESCATLLLIHQPSGVLDAPGRPFDVAMAGHTHAGQIVFGPIVLVVPEGALSRTYLYGRYELELHQHLLVSSGVGNSTVPLRIGASPEVVI